MFQRTGCLVALGLWLAGTGAAKAGPIQWSTVDGGNGHYFDLVLPSTLAGNYSWIEARDAAVAMFFEGSAGHLATVTSQAENDFLRDHFASQLYDSGIGTTDSTYAWIGLFAPTPTSNFEWVTGEPFVYSNWAPSEPNFYGTPLWQYVHYWTRDFGSGPTWTWNNEQNDGYQPQYNKYGFIVEFDGPFTATPEPSGLVLLSIGAFGLLGHGCRRRKG
jgi:hypothetical protein